MNINISKNLEELTNKLDQTINRFDDKELEQAVTELDNLQNEIHQIVKEKLRDPAENLVNRLKEDQQLNEEDKKIIKLWLVGDEEYYTRIENNLLDWMAECKRLFNVLKQYKDQEIQGDENNLLAIGALLTDLKYTLSDVIRYSKAMNEVDKVRRLAFEGTPNTESKIKIAEMIEKKLNSDDY